MAHRRKEIRMKIILPDGSVQEAEDELRAIRHTASHVLAQAVKRLYPDAKLAIGPAIDDGFYYDFDREGGFTPEDLEKLEAEMAKIVKENLPVKPFVLPRAEAVRFMEEKGEPYKVELIEDLPEEETISFYQQGEFVDLCAGPHIMYTKGVKAFKLTSIAGAYWRGSEKNKMLTRIYGTSFTKKAELEEYLTRMEEAKKRDHRKLGKELGLFANLRPAVLYEELKDACPLKPELTEGGFDFMIMRELTGGLYFGERKTEEIGGVMTAMDTLSYNENEIRRIAKRAFDIAQKRSKKVTSVDKANVLDSSRLWRKVTEEVAKDYPDVTLEHMLVDNCAMQIVRNPKQFDVILTENMFGDILSDEASMVTGSIGMLASASLNDSKFGLYEPSGGSAPDIAGKGIANPIATILSAAMMLRFSFDLDQEADAVERAVSQVLLDGYRTGDILSEGCTLVGTKQMGDFICERI